MKFHDEGIALLKKYFDLSGEQEEKICAFAAELLSKNQVVNLISRKDEEHIYERHILHSLSIAKYADFSKQARIMDGGAGGGLPAIPLAVVFPNTQFVMIDSKKKKMDAVAEIIEKTGITNAEVMHSRVEEVNSTFDEAVFRAVAPLPKLVAWSRKSVKKRIWCLKGGDLKEEKAGVKYKVHQRALSELYDEPFFEEKFLLSVSFY